MRDWGESWKGRLEPVFKDFKEKVIDFIRQQWLCFGRFCLLVEIVLSGETLKTGRYLRGFPNWREEIKAYDAGTYRI